MRGFALLVFACVACVPPTNAGEAETSGSTGLPPDLTSGTGEASACLAPPDEVDVAVKFDGYNPISYPYPLELDEACLALGVGMTDVDSVILIFDCDGDPGFSSDHNLEIRLDAPLLAAPLVPQQAVRLRVRLAGAGDSSLHVAVHDSDGELVLAFSSGAALPGDAAFPPPDFFAPLTVAPAWPCPAECPGFDGLFILPECTCVRRGVLEFGYRDLTVQVDDHGVGRLDGTLRHDLRVPALQAIDRDRCEALAPDDSGLDLRFFVARMR